MKRIPKALIAILLPALLAACNTTPERDPEYAPVEVKAIPKPPQGNGAIYQAGFEMRFFEDIKARRVGDLLVVNLVEDTEAKQTNSGKMSKSNSTSITNPTILGAPLSFTLPGYEGDSKVQRNLGTSLASESDFSGSGENTQNNNFSGSLTVMVTEVLPNGYLRVRGEKRLAMTGGNEYIRVAGIVRPTDIDTNNAIDSTKIADATLVYVGDGANSYASQMGWLAKFFMSALLPF